MAARIGTAPRGLLGALQAKIGGENPALLADGVSPVLDIYDQYLINDTGIGRESVAVPIGQAVTTATNQPSTQGVLWRILGVGARVTLNVADDDHATYLEVDVTDPTGAVAMPLIPGQLVAQGGSTLAILTRENGIMLGRPFWLPPGFFIRARVTVEPVPSVAGTLELLHTFHRVVE